MKLLVLALAACGTTEPCDGVTGACIELHVSGTAQITQIDQLELDVLWGTHHETMTTGAGATDLPLVTAITLAPDGATTAGVVAAGKLSGNTLGTAAGSSSLPTGTIELVLVEPEPCVAGSNYCGGDKVAGDPSTLYECNGGGVPHAIKVCSNGCTVNIGNDDTCAP
ncbi:MAG: hypothetical protein QM831_32140 [Kofleriaceae bacterium]